MRYGDKHAAEAGLCWKTRAILVSSSLTLLIACQQLRADIKLPALISDSMVLQQGMKVNLWGTADPGESITVTLNGHKASGVADSGGQWSIKLGPLSPGGPFTLIIAGKNTLTLHDVLVGEVWVCSGQSNMAMTVGPTRPPYFTGVLSYQDEVRNASYPMLHLFTVEKTVASKPQRDVKGYWTAARPDSVNDFSAVGYFFGRELLKTLNVPIGMINASSGTSTAETWMSRAALESEPEFKSILEGEKRILAPYPQLYREFEERFAEWKRASETAETEGQPIPPAPRIPDDPRQNQNRPAALFNGMIAPLTFYAMKGVVWYQGESNTDRPVEYRKLFRALIRDWRRAWGEGDFPFLFVQLASWGIEYFGRFPAGDSSIAASPAPLDFPSLREAQAMALSLPNTGMAVTTDIGDGTDGHPKDKQNVGYRLALAAEAIAYGRDVIYSGPTYDSMAVEGDSIRVRFKNVYGGMIAKNWPPGTRSGFEIAGADRKFVEAEAKIEGETVEVRSDLVAHPIAVRFNWKENPWYHLYNRAGLPASPFRTDQWPDAEIK
jgi:sialate O-acetylesterase